MISINNLSMVMGSKLLFDEVSLSLNKKHRYALVGANGCGKSTFFKLLTQEEEQTVGEIAIPKDTRIGWLRQDQYLHADERIIDIVIRGKEPLWNALQEKQQLLETEWTDASGYRLAALEEIIAHYDGYTAEELAQTLLTGLGIEQGSHYKALSTLSGGYKLRVLLAQALFSQPDILLLDEPTNHLDIMTISWLEKYLKQAVDGVLIFISHDVNFLNSLATHVLDIDYGDITLYVGNYQEAMQEKQAVMEEKLHQKKGLDKKIQEMQRFVDRFKASASRSKQAMSRIKMIDRLELPDIRHSSRISPSFVFEQRRPSGKHVLKVKGLCKSFGDKQPLRDISLNVTRGEKIAIIGHNGMGKSTLLKTLLDIHTPDAGSYTWGHEAHLGYFSQDHHEQLKESVTAFEWLCQQATQVSTQVVRNALGRVLFTKDEVSKNILQLSGGEAARLLLASMMLEQGNVLLLDEPTNHLDVEAIEALAQALINYPGTLLLVSHDRHFVTKIATRVIAFTEGGIKDYRGSYAEYLSHYGEDYLSQAWLARS